MAARVLTEAQIAAALADLPGWSKERDTLRRAVRFPAFLAGIEAVRRIAERAEAADHHPDIDIRWRTVTFALTTHSDGGVTDKDVRLAGEINDIADELGGTTRA